jgi:cysteine desulfurase
MKFPIYLDNHATTPVDPEVLAEMLPWFSEKFGNASSKDHSYGWEAESAVRLSRKRISGFIGVDPKEIIFTSGATESINLAHFGIAQTHASKGRHIITSAVEHNAVLDSFKALERNGFEITILPVDFNGRINIETFKEAIREDTILVSIMTANNEIGNIYDIESISRICKERNIIFHTDATQGVGKIKLNFDYVDLASFSSHKIYGPKGIGALYIKSKTPKLKISPMIYGGGHEKGMRSGTLNVPGIVGFGKAIELASEKFETDSHRIASYRNKMQKAFNEDLDGIHINGDMDNHLPNNLNVSFDGVRADKLMMNLRNIAVSTGSACTSATLKPSHVLCAIGVPDEIAKCTIRFGLGRFNTEEEIDYVIQNIIITVNKLKENLSVKNKEIITH